MGLLNWAKNKAKETVSNFKAERAYGKAEKLERREQYNKGFREGQYKRGIAEGSGQIVPAAARQQPQSSGRRTGASWQPNWKSAGDMYSVGGGFDAFGFGGGQPTRPQPVPMTETKISKSGTVTIRKPVQQAPPPKQENWDPWSMGPPGVSGTPNRKKKDESDPYNFILG